MQNKIIVGLIVLLFGSGYFTFSCWKDKRDAQKNEMVLLKENKRLQLIIADQKIQCGVPCQNLDFFEPTEPMPTEIVKPTFPEVDDTEQHNQQIEPVVQTEQPAVSNQNDGVETKNNIDEELKNEKCINELDQNSKLCQRANSLRMPAKFADD